MSNTKDEMRERALNQPFSGKSIYDVMADFAASEVAKERERIAVELEWMIETYDHEHYGDPLDALIRGLRSNDEHQ